MSNLMKHARQEMRLAGLYNEGADYDGMIPAAVLEVVEVFAKQGHSGMSAEITLSILEKVLRFKTLKPINSDPQYWMDVGEITGVMQWQSTRDPNYFSEDGGKTFYFLDDPEKKNFPERLR
jgi:hypothetical protein